MIPILTTIELEALFKVILYLGLIILIMVAILLAIQLLKTLKKLNTILDNVEGKVNQLNGIFSIVDNVSDGINAVSEKISNFVYDKGNKLIEKKGNEEDE